MRVAFAIAFLVASLSLTALVKAEKTNPSFDCAKARAPDERAICDDSQLATLDNLSAAGFNFVRLKYGKSKALSVAKPLLRLRQACKSDKDCIRRRQLDAVRTYQALGAPITLVEASEISVGEKIYYGSRVGMSNTVVSKSGLDTTNAVIRTRHTRDDALTYCREYAGDPSEKCIKADLEQIPRDGKVTANCQTGVFLNFWGERHQFKGRLPSNNTVLNPKYAIVDLSTGKTADGSSASGYGTNMGIFEALCPQKAPSQVDWFY